MSTQQVLVAYDFSANAEIALRRAIDHACERPSQILHFLTVLDARGDYRTADGIRQDLLAHLGRVLDGRKLDREIELFVHTRLGAPVATILAVAEEIGADLIIVGSHGRSAMGRFLLGSVSEGVLHGARCAVMVARAKGYAYVAPDRIVALPPDGILRNPPQRYSYSESSLIERPAVWPPA